MTKLFTSDQSNPMVDFALAAANYSRSADVKVINIHLRKLHRETKAYTAAVQVSMRCFEIVSLSPHRLRAALTVVFTSRNRFYYKLAFSRLLNLSLL